METTTEKKESPALDYIEARFRGYLDPLDSHGVHREYGGLVFDQAGNARLSAIYGWIVGLRMAGQQEKAEFQAKCLHSRLQFLSDYGGLIEINLERNPNLPKLKIPAYRVQLRDDGTANGFSLAWFAFDKEVSYGTVADRGFLTVGYHPTLQYKFSFNGGMIYHGFNNQTFTVRIGNDENPWGIHT